jgi:hypothetical protein
MLSGNAFIDIHRGLFYYSAGCISIQPSWQSRLTISPSAVNSIILGMF